ncbi:MAG: hypothetical protein NTV56_00505 [Alphaproteobacteria bacterium]|nr:hypothetical protein [Alphaproteobacteria bacterium]
MSNAARRVLDLFLQAPKQGVTGVTGVTGPVVTPGNPVVTPVTPVTYRKQHSPDEGVTGVTERKAKSASVDDTQWGEAEEERAAIIEYDGGAPRAWAEALARLDPSRPPNDLPPKRWVTFVDDCGRFIDEGWPRCAANLGWGPLDLFGCDRVKPYARIDHHGLLWQLNGQRLLALSANAAAIATPTGGYLTLRRSMRASGGVLAWELLREADAP